MKDIGLVLRSVIEKKKMKQVGISVATGFTTAHLWQLLQKGDMLCSQLEKICQAIGISPMSVFEYDGELIVDPQPSAESDDLKTLKALLKEKQKRIDALEDALASTKELLSLYRDKNGTNSAPKAS